MIREYGGCGKNKRLICESDNSCWMVSWEEVHIVIFNCKHPIEPKKTSISKKPADENSPVLSLSFSNSNFFIICDINYPTLMARDRAVRRRARHGWRTRRGKNRLPEKRQTETPMEQTKEGAMLGGSKIKETKDTRCWRLRDIKNYCLHATWKVCPGVRHCVSPLTTTRRDHTHTSRARKGK